MTRADVKAREGEDDVSEGSRVSDAFHLYDPRRAKAWDKLRKEAEDKNRQAVREWGSVGGTAMWAIIGNLMDQLQQQVEHAAALWAEIGRDVPEFCEDDQIEKWRREMYGMLESWESTGIPTSVGRVLGIPREPEAREMLKHPQWKTRLEEIRAIVEREANIMARERKLGTSGRRGGGDVYIQHSTIGAVNLGTIMGDLTATITTLRGQGDADLAEEIERVRAAVESDKELGDRRSDIIQALTAIAQEGQQPPDHRKPSVVKAILEYVTPLILSSAGLVDVWHRAYPLIAGRFGLPH